MRIEELGERISKELEGLAPKVDLEHPIVVVSVGAERLPEAASRLSRMGFDHVKSVTATDYTDEKRVELVYHISSYEDWNLVTFIIALKTSVPPENPRITSLTYIWPSAEFLERETFDLVGVIFEGHPKLTRLLLPDDWEGSPLLKSFKIKTEGIEV